MPIFSVTHTIRGTTQVNRCRIDVTTDPVAAADELKRSLAETFSVQPNEVMIVSIDGDDPEAAFKKPKQKADKVPASA
jgi:hypothetical protein